MPAAVAVVPAAAAAAAAAVTFVAGSNNAPASATAPKQNIVWDNRDGMTVLVRKNCDKPSTANTRKRADGKVAPNLVLIMLMMVRLRAGRQQWTRVCLVYSPFEYPGHGV